MSRPMTRIIDAVTGEVVDRPMNDDEFARWEANKADAEQRQEAADARQAAKESARAKLAKLGLTDDEIAAFLA